jgi:hypothetical protein
MAVCPCVRILKDLDKFSEAVDFEDERDHVRYVTPNIAMEVWNLPVNFPQYLYHC